MRQHWQTIAWAALLVQIPFELRSTRAGLSNLQWTLIALVVLNIPSLYRHRHKLQGDRLVQAAALFVAIQWVAALLAPEFQGNAWKGAIRFTAGFVLMAMARLLPDRIPVLRIWAFASVSAALYALIAQGGLGAPWLFRNGEFFIAQVQRLSGSFEYPNVAAAYFGMSLPIVWWTVSRPTFRFAAALILWGALILTFSRGAAAAVAIVSIGQGMLCWKNRSEWQVAAGLILPGAVAVIISASFSPYLLDMVKRSAPGNPPSAQYVADWKWLQEEPGVGDTIQINIRNTGTIPWLAKGSQRVAVAYKWRNRESQRVERGSQITALPHDVQPGEAVGLSVPFRTPDNPGRYLLIVELFVRNFDWFSNAGVRPAVIEADIQSGIRRSVEQTDGTEAFPVQPDQSSGEPVSRLRLWHAAMDMFRAHPFGVGPDNYRLMYGRFLGLTSWNTNIYSNNLYLELLTGSGLLGLASFALVVFSIPRRAAISSLMGVAVFLVHGFFDVFLMTTPIYFSFWMLVGTCRQSSTATHTDEVS